MQSLTPPELARHDGPFIQQVDLNLKKCGVHRQAHHGRTFGGKSCEYTSQGNYKRVGNLKLLNNNKCKMVNPTLYRLKP